MYVTKLFVYDKMISQFILALIHLFVCFKKWIISPIKTTLNLYFKINAYTEYMYSLFGSRR